MGKFQNGINGPFKGVVGTVVGATWKGIPYMRSKPKKRVDIPGEREMVNRKRFAISQAWLSPLVDYVKEGFRGYSRLSEGFVAAKSYLLKHAIEGEGLDIRVNPALVKLSFGHLPLPNDITAELVEKRVRFTWDTAVPPGAYDNDQVMLLAYNIEKAWGSYIVAGQLRTTGVQDLDLHYIDPGDTYHLYFAMMAPDRSFQSESVYLGTVTL